MPRSPKQLAIAGAVAAVLVVAVVVLASRGGGAPTATPPTPSPTPTEAALPQPEPFRVRLGKVSSRPLDAGNIYARDPDIRRPVARRAARAAADTLQAYLSAALVTPETRFTGQPLRGFLTRSASAQLRPRDRRGLGVAAPEIEGATSHPVTARAVVLYAGRDVFSVTLEYRARMEVVWRDGPPDELVQSGTVVFVPTKQGWRADMLDVTLSPHQRPQPQPPPTPTATAAGATS